MSDSTSNGLRLIERLRAREIRTHWADADLFGEAADEIERLHKTLAWIKAHPYAVVTVMEVCEHAMKGFAGEMPAAEKQP